MKNLKSRIAAGIALAALSFAPLAMADINGEGSGYYYIAFTTINNGGMNTYQYADVGPFSTQPDCEIVRNADYGDGNAWIPFDGTGISCAYVYHGDLGAMEDTLEEWNSLAGGGGGGPIHVDAVKLKAISNLRRTYSIDRYEAEVAEILRAH
jgi:hypothetical protein